MGKFWSKDASPEVKDTEVINVQGNGNVVMTEHLQHLQNISIAISIVAVIVVVGVLIFVICWSLAYCKKKQQRIWQRAIAACY